MGYPETLAPLPGTDHTVRRLYSDEECLSDAPLDTSHYHPVRLSTALSVALSTNPLTPE